MCGLAILFGYIYTCQYQYTPPWNVKRNVQRETARIDRLKQHTIQYEAYKKRIAIIERLAPPEEASKLVKVENDWFEKNYLNPVETNNEELKEMRAKPWEYFMGGDSGATHSSRARLEIAREKNDEFKASWEETERVEIASGKNDLVERYDRFEKKYSNPVETIEPLTKNDTVVEEQKNKFRINPLIIIILILTPYEVIFNLFLINILIVKIIQYIKSEE